MKCKGETDMKLLKNEYIKYMLLSFLFCLFFRVIFLCFIKTMSISGDEIFSLWPAAKILGYDWSGLSTYYRYYGFGYSLLLLPFMAFITNTTVLYIVMVFVMILAQSIVSPISFHIMKNYLNVNNKKVLFFGSIVCSFLVSIRAVYTYPEFIYDLTVWLSIWVMFKLLSVHTKKEKIIYTLLLLLCIGYAMTVHARGITLLISLIVALLFYYWVYRENIISIFTMIIFGIIIYLISKIGMTQILSFLGFSTPENIGNTVAFSSFDLISLLKDPHSWRAWVTIIIGQLNEAIINTGGIAIPIVIILLVIFWQSLRRRDYILNTEKFDYRPYVLVGFFCIFSVVVTIGGQSISNLGAVTTVMNYGGIADSYRNVTYFRYYAAYIGPLLMLGITYFYHKRSVFTWVKNKTLVIFGLLHGFWIFCIIPYIYWYNGTVWSYAPYSFTKGFTDPIRIRTYLIGSLFLIVFIGICYFFVQKKKYQNILFCLCLLLTYNYGYNAIYHEGYRSRMNYEYTHNGIDFLLNLRNEKKLDNVYVEEYYIPEGGQGVHFIYQYHLMNTSVTPNQPVDNVGNIVFICYNPKGYSDLFDQGYSLYQLSDKEFVYLKGEQYIQFAEESDLNQVYEREV